MAPVGSPFGSCILGFLGVSEPSLRGQSAPWREKLELQGSCQQHLLSLNSVQIQFKFMHFDKGTRA